MIAISCGHRKPDDADRRVGDDLIRLRHGDRHYPQFPLTQRICMRPLIASVLVPNDRSAGNSERPTTPAGLFPVRIRLAQLSRSRNDRMESPQRTLAAQVSWFCDRALLSCFEFKR